MLTRRVAIAGPLFGCAASGCGLLGSRPSLQDVELKFPEGKFVALKEAIKGFASEHRFTFADRSLPSSIGTTYTFELRRWDMWIEGLSPLKDMPNEVPMSADGTPAISMEIDEQALTVMFVQGVVEPTEATLDATVVAFTHAVESIDGVQVIRQG